MVMQPDRFWIDDKDTILMVLSCYEKQLSAMRVGELTGWNAEQVAKTLKSLAERGMITLSLEVEILKTKAELTPEGEAFAAKLPEEVRRRLLN